MAKESITWPSFWDGGNTRGPIATQWGVRSWPTTYVLDHNGVIRYKGVRGAAMDKAVDELLKTTPDLPVGGARTWTDLEGRTIEATYISANSTKVTIRRESDGRKFSLLISKLSKEDQQYIEKRMAE